MAGTFWGEKSPQVLSNKVFNLQMEAWDRFAMNYRHFTHIKTYTPADFGLKNYCSTLDDVLTLRGIPRKKP